MDRPHTALPGELGSPPTSGSAIKPPYSRPDQIRQAIRRAVEDEPLWVRILAYQLREGMSDGALERLWRLIK